MAPETETYCARCGTSLAPGAYFCLRCGTSVPLTTGGAGATVAPPVRRPLPAQHNAQLDALRKATLGEYEVLAELGRGGRSEEHTSELQSRGHLVCRLLLEKKNKTPNHTT